MTELVTGHASFLGFAFAAGPSEFLGHDDSRGPYPTIMFLLLDFNDYYRSFMISELT